MMAVVDYLYVMVCWRVLRVCIRRGWRSHVVDASSVVPVVVGARVANAPMRVASTV